MLLIPRSILRMEFTSILWISVFTFLTLSGCKPQLKDSASTSESEDPSTPDSIEEQDDELAEINARLNELNRQTEYYDRVNNKDSVRMNDKSATIEQRAEIRKLWNQIESIEEEKDELEEKWEESNLTISSQDKARALGFHDRKIAQLRQRILEIRTGK